MIPTQKMKDMRSFHNKPELKQVMLEELKWHEEQDKIVQGTYAESLDKEDPNWKGCAVACSIHSLNKKFDKSIETKDHNAYETELGIPETLAHLEDSLFEGMNRQDAVRFPYKFIEAIPVGADLSLVTAKFIVFVLNDVLQYADELGTKAIKDIINIWADVISGKKVKDASWSAAESASWSAVESAARSAVESASWSAAWRAARSAVESAARSAVESASWSAAWRAARSAAHKKYADYLIQLLKESR